MCGPSPLRDGVLNDLLYLLSGMAVKHRVPLLLRGKALCFMGEKSEMGLWDGAVSCMKMGPDTRWMMRPEPTEGALALSIKSKT
ncbi:hypothetical protein DSLASN_45000 [Desulfoluna limicola]|uniref:Uncharacterized protein n=1 Tax=Desulfoluna limicola TaxID=2810562 RepID=A0ABM7PNT1_9BACT|nr:hypothetical protein DSLASN_45000 [Desulfoluna limicola]